MREICPHCHGLALIRSSEAMSNLVRTLYCRCINPACGHAFVAHAEIVLTLSPPAVPNPAVLLPLSPHINCKALLTYMSQARSYSDKKPPAPQPVKPAAPAPARKAASTFRRTKRDGTPADKADNDNTRAASFARNTWFPLPGFTAPADIGAHLPAEKFKLT